MDEYLGTSELAHCLKISVRTVKNWLRQGSVPSLTLPNSSGGNRRFRRLFRLSEVHEWLEARRPKRYNVPTMGLYRRTTGKNKSDVWHYSFTADGQRVFGSTGETDKQKALEVFTRKHQECLEGKRQAGPGISLGKMVEKYLEWSKANHTRNTYLSNAFIARTLLRHLDPDGRLSRITAEEVEGYRIKRRDHTLTRKGTPPTPARINRELTFLQGMFTKALQWGLVGRSPFEHRAIRRLKEEQKPERFLTEEEKAKLIEACSDKLRPIVLFALNTGLRMGEILSLKWRNVNIGKRIVFVEHTKSHRVRNILLSEQLAEMLKRLPKRGPCVFSHEDGRPWSRHGLDKAFDRAVLRAGISHLTFHDLRHSFALSFLEAATSATAIYDLQRILGHSSLTVTQRYLAALDRNIRRGMEGVSSQMSPEVWGKAWGTAPGEDGEEDLSSGEGWPIVLRRRSRKPASSGA